MKTCDECGVNIEPFCENEGWKLRPLILMNSYCTTEEFLTAFKKQIAQKVLCNACNEAYRELLMGIKLEVNEKMNKIYTRALKNKKNWIKYRTAGQNAKKNN